MIGAILVLIGALILSFILDDLLMARDARDKALHDLQAGLRKQNIAQIEALKKAGILREYVKGLEKK